jgi:hypothetical protein
MKIRAPPVVTPCSGLIVRGGKAIEASPLPILTGDAKKKVKVSEDGEVTVKLTINYGMHTDRKHRATCTHAHVHGWLHVRTDDESVRVFRVQITGTQTTPYDKAAAMNSLATDMLFTRPVSDQLSNVMQTRVRP